MTFLKRIDGGLTVIFYWLQSYFDKGIEPFIAALDIAGLEFFFLYPDFMEGKEGYSVETPNEWARKQGPDPRIWPGNEEKQL